MCVCVRVRALHSDLKFHLCFNSLLRLYIGAGAHAKPRWRPGCVRVCTACALNAHLCVSLSLEMILRGWGIACARGSRHYGLPFFLCLIPPPLHPDPIHRQASTTWGSSRSCWSRTFCRASSLGMHAQRAGDRDCPKFKGQTCARIVVVVVEMNARTFGDAVSSDSYPVLARTHPEIAIVRCCCRSSAGAVIGAIVCCKQDSELRELFESHDLHIEAFVEVRACCTRPCAVCHARRYLCRFNRLIEFQVLSRVAA